jgi:hypothetical protein
MRVAWYPFPTWIQSPALPIAAFAVHPLESNMRPLGATVASITGVPAIVPRAARRT